MTFVFAFHNFVGSGWCRPVAGSNPAPEQSGQRWGATRREGKEHRAGDTPARLNLPKNQTIG